MLGLATPGIVSAYTQNSSVISPECGEVIYIPVPEENLKVLDRNGGSWTVYAATKIGGFLCFDRGKIALSEL